MSFLSASQVVKQYSGHLALDRLDLEVPQNSIFGLLGPNGAGKTTFIRIINQITAPDSGSVLINGEKLSPKHIHHIGYLPEERGLYKKMKVGEQALYLCRLKGLSRPEAFRQLKFWFEKFEITEWWDKKVEELSKGMQQKVQFIITILHKPKLLIFDEPFSGFDPINTNLLKQEILRLRYEGATILFSTHNMSSVEEICDHIALINKSKKILDGNINDVRNKYASGIYEFSFRGYFQKLAATLTASYEILETKEADGINTIKLRLLDKSLSENDLIRQMLNFGTITSFNMVTPSMNDIFIKAVGDARNQE
ncbi:MAG TPA: ATP-binding cassette domain-containing protein [Bacteroidales bacterium]|nr:ATP-binding cassette domain-containing protein [Bacteroidales bacterium]